jgi:hypothetical protein
VQIRPNLVCDSLDDSLSNVCVRGWPSGRASAFQADLDGFDSRTPLLLHTISDKTAIERAQIYIDSEITAILNGPSQLLGLPRSLEEDDLDTRP